jgi:hypothetical protein
MLTDYEFAGKIWKRSLEKELDKIIVPSLLQHFMSCFFKNKRFGLDMDILIVHFRRGWGGGGGI